MSPIRAFYFFSIQWRMVKMNKLNFISMSMELLKNLFV